MSIEQQSYESYSVVEQISWRIGLVGAAALPGRGWRGRRPLVTLGEVFASDGWAGRDSYCDSVYVGCHGR